MEENTFGRSLVKVVRLLLDNKNACISDDEFTKISPEFGERIIDELIAYRVVESSKDGLYFSMDNFEELKTYLRRYGVNTD